MSARRLWVVHTLIFALLGFSLASIATGQEWWPFSPYQMFSKARTDRSLTRKRVFAVTVDGREFPLIEDAALRPFDKCRLARAFLHMAERQGRGGLYREALRDVVARYERGRRAGWHDGPAISGARLYLATWSLDAWARNLDSPDERVRLAEWPPIRERGSP